MKSLRSILMVLTILVTLSTGLQAQWVDNASTITKSAYGLTLHFSGTMDSTLGTYGTLTSNLFSMNDYDNATDIDYSYLVTNAPGAPKVKITLLHSNETTTAANMVAAVLQDSIKTELELSSYKTFQGIRSKYYRLKLESLAGGRKTSVFSVYLTIPKRDF